MSMAASGWRIEILSVGRYMSRALFLDRDGVLNVDSGYVHKCEEFLFVQGVIEFLRTLKEDFKLFIITNQSGIGRGYFGLGEYYEFMEYFCKRYLEEGIEFCGVYFCPHAPEDDCGCRKPAPGLIERAAREHGLDLENSWLIGDKLSDIKAAQAAGVGNSILFNDSCSQEGVMVTDSLQSALAMIQSGRQQA